ncbi:MAG: aminotransferase class III-fold pyridoxal phosphate-dependent enzyme, partial [Desulfovibrionales bacterium]|nr:aminotransferase class III-fold pyridoxal phosphate-dependent enzyme [Desulfovibrionales bacterium]
MESIPGNLFPRSLDAPLPRVESAQGLFITDTEGKQYMDASGGAVVVNLGHGREKMARAVYDQICSHHYVHPTMFTTAPAENLARALAQKSKGQLGRFYFFSGGSEANEGAIKLARQIQMARGQESRYRIIGRWKSYHGLTLGALGVMGRTNFKHPFAPMVKDSLHIPAPYCYRCYFGLEPATCDLRCAQALDQIIEESGPSTIAAFMAETIPGATIAAAIPPKGYLERIADICDHHGVLLILDEVMCGTGRCGSFFAWEQTDVVPDMVTLGKGLAGGVVPLSALGVKEEHFNLIHKSKEGFIHGGTFSHHPVACAAGLALMDILDEEDLIQAAATQGKLLGHLLDSHLSPLPWVGDIRGTGLLWGIELVANKREKTPFNRNLKTCETLWKKLFNKGYILYKATGVAAPNG